MRYALVFLGNPGREYARTRHNVAWMVHDRLIEQISVSETPKNKFNALNLPVSIGNSSSILSRPQKMMNLSGASVQALMNFYNLDLNQLVVIHDDLETPYGKISFQKGGGHSGHNGLRSIFQALGSAEFYRLKIGIGRPRHGSVHSFVLGRFSPDEELSLERILNEASSLLIDQVRQDSLRPGRIDRSVQI